MRGVNRTESVDPQRKPGNVSLSMADASRQLPFFSGRIPAVTVASLGLVVSILAYGEARQRERHDAQAEFVRLASVRHALTVEILGRYEDALAGLRTMFTLEENVGRIEFVQAARRVEERSAHVQAFEWVPLVTAGNRASAEETIGRSYGRPAEFTELASDQRLVRAAERLEYYPITYIHPLESNERALGYDLQTGPTRTQLETARRTQQMTATGLVKLIQEAGDKLSVIMIWPVFRATSRPSEGDQAAENPPRFLGFVEGILDIRAVLERTQSAAPDHDLDALFLDASATEPTLRFLHYVPSGHTKAEAAPPREEDFRQGFRQAHSLPIGGREWQVLYRPRVGWLEEKRTIAPVLRGSGVLLVTALLAGLVHTLGRRTNVIEKTVTERTAELSESRRQLSSVMHALPGMAFRCRANREHTVLYASEGALSLTGHSAEDFMNGRVFFRQFIHPDDLPRVRAATEAGLAERKEFEVEYRVRSRDGVEKWVFSRSRGVHDPNGTLEFFEGLVIDTTVQKRSETERLTIERKLLEGQKLESLGLLAGGIAHDFNNLLTGVLGNASLLRLALPPSESTDPLLKSIENASLRAAELCRQMLAYAGKGQLVVEPIALGALVEGMLPLLNVSIGRGVRVHLELSSTLPFVRADATQLRQIVMNLVINASDAIGSRSGDIFLSTGVVTMEESTLRVAFAGEELRAGEYVFLEVRDTGCGMDAETMKKIFDPFFSTKFAGRGLGLAAALGIVRKHEGALKVESTPGVGSIFRLLLPPARGGTPPTPPTPTARPWSHTGRVLIIEDDDTVRAVAAEVVKSYGLSAQLASDGESGIAAFKKTPNDFDVVMLDLIMPGMSGEETLAALRAVRRDVTVLIMSGYSETDALSRLADPQSRLGFLHKPFTRDMLKGKLRALLG